MRFFLSFKIFLQNRYTFNLLQSKSNHFTPRCACAVRSNYHTIKLHKAHTDSLFLRPACIDFSWLTLFFFVRVTGKLSSFQNKTFGVLSLFHHTYDGCWQLRAALPAPQVNSVQTTLQVSGQGFQNIIKMHTFSN